MLLIGLIFEYVPDKVVVLVKRGKIVMPAAMNADKSYQSWVYLLQGNTMPDGNKQIFGAMNNVGVAIYFGNPEIGA